MKNKRFLHCLATIVATSVMALAQHGGTVMPAQAKPRGYSLDTMAKALALFDTSGNQMQFYPKTPFQILFQDPNKTQFQSVTCPNGGPGFLVIGVNSFAVRSGTPYFVPLFSVDDSPPVLGAFPTEESQIEDYFFSPDEYGGRGFAIIVDGKQTSVGPEYLAGPIEQTSPPLQDGGGTHLIQLGVFLTPLTPGAHTVTIVGQVASSALFSTYGFNCLQQDDTYAVKVF
jgi:hypothetical protein